MAPEILNTGTESPEAIESVSLKQQGVTLNNVDTQTNDTTLPWSLHPSLSVCVHLLQEDKNQTSNNHQRITSQPVRFFIIQWCHFYDK